MLSPVICDIVGKALRNFLLLSQKKPSDMMWWTACPQLSLVGNVTGGNITTLKARTWRNLSH